MAKLTLSRPAPFQATCRMQGDKSLAHRALILAALAQGTSRVQNVPTGADVGSTILCLRQLGIQLAEQKPGEWSIFGRGLQGWKEPTCCLDAGNAGTTARLLLGALAGQPLAATLIGDHSLGQRPFAAVVEPLRQMGALLVGRQSGHRLPLTIRGGALQGQEISMAQASAQTKSCLLLAGLAAEGVTTIHTPLPTRDHTERMLPSFGAACQREGDLLRIEGPQALQAAQMWLPGDFSSAAFGLGLALLTASQLSLYEVGLNPHRTGLLSILRRMGARLQVRVEGVSHGEPWGRITTFPSDLQGTTVSAAEIPRVVDELPLLAVLATQAQGRTRVLGAEVLRDKEVDRLHQTAVLLRGLGAQVVENPGGWEIIGPTPLAGSMHSQGDHRLAMAGAVAGAASEVGVTIEGMEACAVSYPLFLEHLQTWCAGNVDIQA